MSSYKTAANRKREIPVSSCPTQFEHHLYSGKQVKNAKAEKALFAALLDNLDANGPPVSRNDKPGKKHVQAETNAHRIAAIKAQFPGCIFAFCYVDTENVFTYDGRRFQIDISVQAYQPKETKHGLLYDVDQIVIVQSQDGAEHYYTQQFHAIRPELVTAG